MACEVAAGQMSNGDLYGMDRVGSGKIHKEKIPLCRILLHQLESTPLKIMADFWSPVFVSLYHGRG